jgi:hypothetical protein
MCAENTAYAQPSPVRYLSRRDTVSPHHDRHRQWQLRASSLRYNTDENIAILSHGPPLVR